MADKNKKDSMFDETVVRRNSKNSKTEQSSRTSESNKRTAEDRRSVDTEEKGNKTKTAGNRGKKGRKRRRRAVRRKETPFQKYFQKIGGAVAFILLILTTILTGRNMIEASKETAEADVEAGQLQQEMVETAQSTPEETPVPTMRPRALPIPENVPEQDVQGFFANGIASVDGQSVTILCGGDNLIHEPIYERARTDSSFNFNYLYDNVRSFIQSADIATINQEAPLATDLGDPSGYPLFNTPKEVGLALENAGFDIINIANNHIYDQGSAGALITEQFFQNRGIPAVGFYNSDEDYHNIRIIECNGIKVAFLSFVEYTNIEPDDEDKGFVITMEERSRVKEQIEEARSKADIVAVHAHWGDEGTTELSDGQVEMAHLMTDWGADIIFGNHPHVIQQLTILTRESDSQLCPVIYSMGNFVSGQTHRGELVSAMLAVKVTRDTNGIARPSAMGVMPVITHFTTENRGDIIIYPMASYSEQLAESHAVNALDGDFTIDSINSLINAQIPDRYLNRMSSLTAMSTQ